MPAATALTSTPCSEHGGADHLPARRRSHGQYSARLSSPTGGFPRPATFKLSTAFPQVDVSTLCSEPSACNTSCAADWHPKWCHWLSWGLRGLVVQMHGLADWAQSGGSTKRNHFSGSERLNHTRSITIDVQTFAVLVPNGDRKKHLAGVPSFSAGRTSGRDGIPRRRPGKAPVSS